MEEQTRRCPYCAEEIHLEAKKCKHCGEWLATHSAVVPATPAASGTTTVAAQQRTSLGVLAGIIVGLLMVGAVVGVIATALSQGVAKGMASPEEKAMYELCEEDPDCHLPFMNAFGYLGLFGTIGVGVLATRSLWRHKV